jgi:hypothetical protein
MEWKVVQLDRVPATGEIKTVHWEVVEAQGAVNGKSYGTCDLIPKSASDPTFIPYENLTQAQVIQWVKDSLGPDEVAKYEASVQRQIDAQKAPALTSGLPWSA